MSRLVRLAPLLLAFAFLWLLWPEPLVHPDTTRDWLMARDCAGLSQCVTMGATTSLAGLRQGALWIDLLATALRADVSPTAVHLALLGLHAATAAAAKIGTASWSGWALALLGTVVCGPATQWNPTLSWPFAVLGALWWRRGGAGMAGLLWGVALDSHPVHLALVCLAAGAEVGLRRWREAALLGLLPLLVVVLASPQTVVVDATALASRPALGLAPLVVVVGAAVLASWRPQPLLLALVGTLGLMAAPYGMGHYFEPRYLLASLPLWLAVWPRLAPLGLAALPWLALAAATSLALSTRGDQQNYTMAEAEALASELQRAEIGWPSPTTQVAARDGQELAMATAIWLADEASPASDRVASVGERAPATRALSRRLAVRVVPSRLRWNDAQSCASGVCQPLEHQQAQGAEEGFAARARHAPLRLAADARFVELHLPLGAGAVTTLRLDRAGASAAFVFCDAAGGDRLQVSGAAQQVRLCADLTRPQAGLLRRQPMLPMVFSEPYGGPR